MSLSRLIVSSPYALVFFVLETFLTLSASASDDIPGDAPARGLVRREQNVAPGYTLISPFSSKSAFLIDAAGIVVHKWESRYNPGLATLGPTHELAGRRHAG